MPADDVLPTKKIAQLRMHIERAIGRIKDYQILLNTLHATMWDSINEVIYVCYMMTNLAHHWFADNLQWLVDLS